MSTQLVLTLDKTQVHAVVTQYLDGLSHAKAVDLLEALVISNFHSLDHVQLVRDFQKIVIKQCNLPNNYFEENP